eukprot:7376381-Prymnesium_polylepis.1
MESAPTVTAGYFAAWHKEGGGARGVSGASGDSCCCCGEHGAGKRAAWIVAWAVVSLWSLTAARRYAAMVAR